MSQDSFLEFLISARRNATMLSRYNLRNFSELLFQAKNDGFDFTADEVAEVIGKLEANVILNKDRDPYDGTSRLWHRMWGRRHFEYLINDVVNRHTDQELRSMTQDGDQEII
jgi:hypothetical protein